MRALGVGAAVDFQADAADLADVVVQVLDPLGHSAVADHALGDALRPVGCQLTGGHGRLRRRLLLPPGGATVGLLQHEPPHQRAVEAGLGPVLGDGVEAVIPVAEGRRVRGAPVGATDHADWQSSLLGADQGQVAASELLVCHLSVGAVLAALAGVDDPVALVAVVGVATGHDDRVGPVLNGRR
jgi:hypothetical protein